MAEILTRGNSMPTAVVEDMFNAVKGHSALAKLSTARPIAFNGSTVFVFNMDSEADIVAENGAKSNGGGTATAVNVVPIKMEYGMRVSDEFMRGAEEYRMRVTEDFVEGAARKFARALDIGAMHGLNPRTMTASAVIGENNIDAMLPETHAIGYAAGSESNNLEDALAKVEGVNGIALAPTFSAGLGKSVAGNMLIAPEYMFGGNPETFHGMKSDVNSTVEAHLASAPSGNMAYVGDFDAFRWGYASDVEFEVIEYGNPDNSNLGDLKGHNQVYLRCEAYIGWGILDANAFAAVTTL